MPAKTYHRYRLQKDVTITQDSMSLEGHVLRKPTEDSDNWLIVPFPLDRLAKHMRTKDNLKGIVEYQEFDPFSPSIPVYAPPLVAPEKYFTRDDLYAMNRKELENASKGVGVLTVNVKDENLIKKILQEQEVWKKKSSPVVKEEEVVVESPAPTPEVTIPTV